MLLTTVLLTLTTFSYAQRISWGLKAGVNISGVSNFEQVMGSAFQQSGVPNMSLKSRPYFNIVAGAYVKVKLSDHFSLQPELSYSVQGYSSKAAIGDSVTNASMKVNLRQNYFNIPVMVQYSPVSNFYLEAGPQIGFLTASKIIAKVQGQSNSQDAKDAFKTTDFSATFGAGFKLPNLPLGFYARFVLGLGDVADGNDTDTKFKNRTGQVGIFYQFGH